MNVMSGQVPGDGPLYFNFPDDVTYRFHIDNDMDGLADDLIYEFSFTSEHRPAYGELTFPLSYVGNPLIQSRPELRGILALDGPGSEGITFRQTYTVTEIRDGKSKAIFDEQKLIAVPSNVGPVTMPNYEMLAAQGVYTTNNDKIRVFAGQRADVFFADTGALFDGAAPRRNPPLLTPDEEADNSSNPFGFNNYAKRNTQTIAIEIPIRRITADRKNSYRTKTPFIGVFASASRKLSSYAGIESERQVSRMGNPLINTFVIDVISKDLYNQSQPELDGQFLELFANPPLARQPTSEIFGAPVPPPPRTDLVAMYLHYPTDPLSNLPCNSTCADLLRVNLTVIPTPAEQQHRMGAIMGGDSAGVPNGRRPGDDIVDFTVRAIGGPALIGAKLGDGVNYANDVPGAGFEDGPGYGEIEGNRLDTLANGLVKEFPFLPTPHSGR